MGIIYIDLLVIINLYITFFLLKGTAAFLHRKITNRRILAGSLAGGVFSLMILLPPLPFLVNILVKMAAGMLIVLIAFGYKPKQSENGYAEQTLLFAYFKNALIFLIINVVFAGLTLMLWFFAAPFGMEYNNGVAYFDISFTTLIITTILAYGLIRFLRYILDTKHVGERSYKLTVSAGGNTVTMDAIADSGNMLVDYFSGTLVIICPYSTIGIVSPVGVLDKEPPVGILLLPYNTIDSSGLIPVFKADEIIIKSDNMPDKPVKALIGVTQKDSPAIFNPKLLI
jgi:stage II sporulation protein GA (sporulation sigma-E factor processing peptidase)